MLFSQIDCRLQQIKQNCQPFGNLHMILVGDLFQLKPVSYTWIFENISSTYGPLATNLWKTYFTMYELSEIMRQKDDKTYAELLSRLRKGNHSRNDIETLETRMIEENSTNYPFDALHMFATNAEVNTFNETVYNRTCTEKVVIVAKSAVFGDVTSTVKLKTMENLNNAEKYKKHTNTGGLMTELNLAIDLHYDCTINLDVDDGLTNGATCLLKKIEYKEGFSQPAILWVHFVEPSVGKACRQKYRNLYSRSVQRSWTPIFAVSRTFIVSRALVSRQQFPLCPSSARTIHKCQGQTLQKAVVKMGDRMLAHSHYTALSRVTSLNNLHILRLNEQKISVNQSVKEEMHDLRVNRQVILCYTPVYALSACKHRIIFHNIRSLHAHFEDILHNSNYIAAIKTSFLVLLYIYRYTYCSKSIPGWSEYVEPLRKEALFWHSHCKSCGKPHNGLEAELRRISRARYHMAVRSVLKDQDDIRMERMATAILDSNHRDLWREVKKIKGRANIIAANIDGCSDENDIVELFSNKYCDLYNSVPFNPTEMCHIVNEIETRLERGDCSYKIESSDVRTAISHLKLGKSDGEEGLNSDHIINGSAMLQKYLTLVFNAMISHGISPDSMLNGTMVPIPKGKGKAIIYSDNYRAITLSSILCKVFDWIILIKENNILRSSDLQFGFKEHASTTQCIFALNEVISYYNSKGSDVFAVFLDATKAFDRIIFCKLFRKLLDRNMPPLLLRFLRYMYTNQNLQVRWCPITVAKFGASNGVKQGAVLSPVLFSVYMDDLYFQLKESGNGCYIGNHYVGSLGYADDTVLMSPSLKGLQKMVDISVDYASKHDIIYDGSKSQSVIFPTIINRHTERHIIIGGERLQNVNDAVHLGHHVSAKNKDCMLQSAISQFWRSFNIFRSDFGKLHPDIQCELFKTYCSSFYGAPLWNINSKCFRQLCAAWRKCLRKIWRVHQMTHCDIITLVSRCKPIEIGIQQRFCKFAANIFQNGSPVLQTITMTALNNPFLFSVIITMSSLGMAIFNLLRPATNYMLSG